MSDVQYMCDEPMCPRTDTTEYKRRWTVPDRSDYNPRGIHSVFWCPEHRERGDEHPIDCDENQVLASELLRAEMKREAEDANLRQRLPLHLPDDEAYDRVVLEFAERDYLDKLGVRDFKTCVVMLEQFSYWKDSWLSGSEWRTRWKLTVDNEEVAVFGGLGVALSALYSTLRDHEKSAKKLRGMVLAKSPQFSRKQQAEWFNDFQSADWKDALARLAPVLIDRPFNISWQEHLCFQPGCCAPVSVRLVPKRRTDRCGNYLDSSELLGRNYRAFCEKHARRGTASREDSDDNYSKEYDRPAFVFSLLSRRAPFDQYNTTSPDAIVDALISTGPGVGVVALRDKAEAVAVRKAFQMRGWALEGRNVVYGSRRLMLDGSTYWSADRIRAWKDATPTREAV